MKQKYKIHSFTFYFWDAEGNKGNEAIGNKGNEAIKAIKAIKAMRQ